MAKIARRIYAAPALAAGLALVLASATPAAADFFNSFGGTWQQRYYYRDHQEPAKPRLRHHRKTNRHREQKVAHKRPAPQGPYQIVISIAKQQVALYGRNGLIERAGISTGRPDHPTPMGVFSVISKARWHRSNIYSGAPMPFMQRITWSGIALHAGPRPGYPASHGCIRLPTDFAVRLFGTTRVGARVVVTREPVAPVEIASPKLFVPKMPDDQAKPVTVATADSAKEAMSFAARSSNPAKSASAAVISDAPAAAPPPTEPAVAEPMASEPPAAAPAPITGAIPLPQQAPADARKRLTGPVSVFVSLKQKRVFVRQGFHELFDMPVTIADPDKPIGTHVYTAMGLTDGGKAMRWTAMTIPSTYRHHRHERRVSKRHRHRKVEEAAQPAASTAAEALDRVTLPPAAVESISAMLTPGSSLIVSDNRLSDETDRSTNFIVLTR